MFLFRFCKEAKLMKQKQWIDAFEKNSVSFSRCSPTRSCDLFTVV